MISITINAFNKPDREGQIAAACKTIYDYADNNSYVKVQVEGQNTRTKNQNAAMHVYFRLLAEALNAAGLDQKKVLKPEVDIPWDEGSVKKMLWKPIQAALEKSDSTRDLKRPEVSEVYDVLNRHLAQKFGVSVEFPRRD